VSTPEPSAPPEVPVCYRHPDRETYIRCTRCERPICPDCMTSAAVGFQCPECVAAGAASTPAIRSRLGAVVPSRPYVTFSLIGLCVVVYGLEMLRGIEAVSADWAMWPVGIALDNEYYRLVTSMFVHYSLLHIGFNMLVLWMLGPQLEQVLGHVRFSVLYLVAGLGGSVASFWFSDPRVLAAGASGAIFGLMGAYVVVGKALRADVTQVLGLIAVNIVIGFAVPNTDWRAHLGGLVTGAVVGAVLAYAPTRNRVLVQTLAVVAVLAVLGLLVLVRDQQITEQIVLAVPNLR
jgi:membrane associated rhomboid family serine protease